MKVNKKIFIALFILMLILLALLIYRAAAKYVIRSKNTHVQESSEFYFESKIADANGTKEYTINDWDGIETKKIGFSIKNYIDILQYTNENITYNINVTDVDSTNLLNLKIYNSSNKEIVSGEEQTLKGGQNRENEYELQVQPKTRLEENQEFNLKLTIKSTQPYTKELTCTLKFIVNKPKEYKASFINYGDYVVLNLVNYQLYSNINVKYDNTKLILDESNSLINGTSITTNGTQNSFSISKEKLQTNHNYEILFIKISESTTIELGKDIILET